MPEIVSDAEEVPDFRHRVDWQAFVDLMNAHPGKWVKEATASGWAASSAARRLRGTAPAPLGKVGEFEVHTVGDVVWGRTASVPSGPVLAGEGEAP